jgi:oxygen-independent coproporphyrinogen III oxidase
MQRFVDPVTRVAMWNYHPELLERTVPRYTSYPTAAEFSSSVGVADMAEALADVPRDEDISLYVHIPYCHEICWYCGCNTGLASRSHRLTAYVEALEREIALVARQLGGRGRVRRIAWGGGSPNALAPVDFVRLLQQILLCFGTANPEIGVELDPRTLDRRWIDTLGTAGVGRVSMGVQTFAPHIQAQIGRTQSFDLIELAVMRLRQVGITTVGFDLMYGLPSQSLEDLSETLTLAASLQPDRIALFGYAHMPNLLPRQRRIDTAALPDRRARFDLAQYGHVALTDAGYLPVGFDHFSRRQDGLARAATTGTLHRNFQGFTDDPARIVIGLGATAISQFPDRIIQNEKNLGRYRARAAQGELPAARGCHVSAEDRRVGALIFDILAYGRARLPAHRLSQDQENQLRVFEARGLASRQGDELLTPPEALPYRRSIAAIFDRYLAFAETRFSNAI